MEWQFFAGSVNFCVSFAKTVIIDIKCRRRPSIYKANSSLSPRRTAFNTNAYVSMFVYTHTHICAYICVHIYIYIDADKYKHKHDMYACTSASF